MFIETDKIFKEKTLEMEKRFESILSDNFTSLEKRLETKMKNHFQALLNQYLTLGTEI